MAQTCPRDGVALVPTKDLLGPGTTGHVCPKCAGVLVAWDSAQKFFEALGLPLQDLQVAVAKFQAKKKPTAPAPCSSCGKGTFSGFLHQGVEMDLCTECGAAWFDRGELARVSKGKYGAGLGDAPKALEGETVREDGVFEMLWDCAHCETRALLAKTNKCCPACGAQQDASRRYFPEPGQEIVANAEYDGADAACPACNTPNGAKAKNCRSCGSPMDGSAKVATVADRVVRAAPADTTGPGKKGTPMWVWGVAAAVVLMCGMCGVVTMWTKDAKATVAGHRWTREIEIESMEARSDSSWCDSMPSGAYDVSRSKEQRSTKKIPDGETCGTRDVDRGDGTFKRQKECKPKYREEPVYDDKCRYTIDRWGRERSVTAKGASLSDSPEWPAVRLSRTGNCRGCEREGSRSEKYTLDLKGPKGEKWDCDVGESKWRAASEGAVKDVKVRVIGGGVDCGSL